MVVSTQLKVMLELNQQQAQLVEQLLKEGGYGSVPGEIIHNVFRRYCEAHPELVKTSAPKPRRRLRHG